MCDGIDDTVRDDSLEAARLPAGAIADSGTTPPTVAGSPYAGLVSRLAALAVDVVILTLAGALVSVMPAVSWQHMVGRSPRWVDTASAIAAGALPWVYFTIAWWMGGRTIGGLLMGTAVERPDGRRILLVVAALRSIIGLALAPLWLVGLVGVLWDERRRALHDLVFHTVVRRTSIGARPSPSIFTSRRVNASQRGSESGTPK